MVAKDNHMKFLLLCCIVIGFFQMDCVSAAKWTNTFIYRIQADPLSTDDALDLAKQDIIITAKALYDDDYDPDMGDASTWDKIHRANPDAVIYLYLATPWSREVDDNYASLRAVATTDHYKKYNTDGRSHSQGSFYDLAVAPGAPHPEYAWQDASGNGLVGIRDNTAHWINLVDSGARGWAWEAISDIFIGQPWTEGADGVFSDIMTMNTEGNPATPRNMNGWPRAQHQTA